MVCSRKNCSRVKGWLWLSVHSEFIEDDMGDWKNKRGRERKRTRAAAPGEHPPRHTPTHHHNTTAPVIPKPLHSMSTIEPTGLEYLSELSFALAGIQSKSFTERPFSQPNGPGPGPRPTRNETL